jgi:hypothetical protein
MDNSLDQMSSEFKLISYICLYFSSFLVMEVSFPLTNYSFPRGNITDRFGKEFQSDQIFIPIQALATENGGE